MADKAKIEWTDATWNPLRGCSKVSGGCRNCYAESVANRFSGPGQPYEGTIKDGRWNGQIRLVPDVLSQPLKWKRPRRIFVNSMSDLFHANVPDDYIWSVFETMACATQHTFQVLTKRPERMRDLLKGRYWRNLGTEARAFYARIVKGEHREGDIPYLPNVWLGVSVENQKAADERIPLLVDTPAAVRFLSCEPLLGPVNLGKWLLTPGWTPSYYDLDNIHGYPNAEPTNEHIQWVIVGGESGRNARPMNPDWARSLRDQCHAASVPYLFKQWGEWAPGENFPDFIPSSISAIDMGHEEHGVWKVGKKAAGRELDGRTWDEYPKGRQ